MVPVSGTGSGLASVLAQVTGYQVCLCDVDSRGWLKPDFHVTEPCAVLSVLGARSQSSPGTPALASLSQLVREGHLLPGPPGADSGGVF